MIKFKCIVCNGTIALSDIKCICLSCGFSYDLINSLPYLGNFCSDEVLSLFEILAVRSTATAPDNSFEGLSDNDWMKFVQLEYEGESRELLMKKFKIKNLPDWYINRFNEYIMFRSALYGIDLSDKLVLDVGAGSGYGARLLRNLGAHVVAFEFNPQQLALGASANRDIQWVGGSAHSLPFFDHQFDLVVANATLHHLTNLNDAVEEMFRVVKQGGHVITLSDGVRGNQTDEVFDVEIFKNNNAVLRGVNERFPTLNELISPFIKFKNYFQTHIYASEGWNPRQPDWGIYSLDEVAEEIGSCISNVSIKSKKTAEILIQPKTNNSKKFISADELLSLSNDEVTGKIVSHVNSEYFNLELLENNHPKFRLLNGQRYNSTNTALKECFSRVRTFWTKNKIDNYLDIEILAPALLKEKTFELIFTVQGIPIEEKVLQRGVWHNVFFKMPIILDEKIVIEFKIKSKFDTDDQFLVFFIRGCKWANKSKLDSHLEFDKFNILTLRDMGNIDDHISVIVGTDFSYSSKVLLELKNHGFTIDLVCDSRQTVFYQGLNISKSINDYTTVLLTPNFFLIYEDEMDLVEIKSLIKDLKLKRISSDLKVENFILQSEKKMEKTLFKKILKKVSKTINF